MVSNAQFTRVLREPGVIGAFNRRYDMVLNNISSFMQFQHCLDELNAFEARIRDMRRNYGDGFIRTRKYGRLINMCNRNRGNLMRTAASKMIKENPDE